MSVPAFTGSAHCTQDDTGDKAVGYLFPTTELLPFAQETSENTVSYTHLRAHET